MASRVKRGSAGSAMSDIAVPAEPMTMVGVQEMGNKMPRGEGKKMKKKKTTKLSAAEKARTKLETETEEIRKSGQPFRDFVDRMDTWLKKNSKRAIDLFRRFDTDGEGVLTFEEFKAGLVDLGIPCSAVELHLVCQLFDKFDNDEVDFLDIAKGMACAREQEEAYLQEDVRPRLPLTDRTLTKCPCCKMTTWNGEPYRQQFPRYVLVTLRLVTFDVCKVHPAHFTGLVHSHITIQGLMGLVAESTDLLTTQMAIFTDKSRDPKAMLLPYKTLEEYNYMGGTKVTPEEVLLYYDYKVEFKDCPLLMCDFYFGQKIKT